MSLANDKILRCWEQHHQKHQDRTRLMPILYPDFKTNSLLFVGLNPSYNKDYVNHINGCIDFYDFNEYLISDKIGKKERVDRLIRNEEISRGDQDEKMYPYYRKFPEIAASVNLPWEHLDLFFEHEANSGKIKNNYLKISKKPSNHLIWKAAGDFAKQQLNMTLTFVNAIEPKIIVVANAFASKVVQAYWPQKVCSKQFEEKGYHFFIMDNKKRIPLFFSGMLTMQHSLDCGSLERLKWHIKQAVKK